jgi:hypothetical protein
MLSSWQKSEDNNGGDSFLDGGVGRLQLKRFIERLEKSALIHIRLEGHTDALGSPDYNQRLSLKRRKRCMTVLLNKAFRLKRSLCLA